MTRGLWVAWLKIASVATVVVGLVASAASHPAGEEPWRLLFDLILWPVDGAPGTFAPETRMVNAVVGGVMAGWGALMYGLAAGPIARGDANVARLVLTGVLVWFLVDSTGSFVAGAPGNVALNVLFLVAFVVPLIALRRPR